ncbi:hypothetical protein K443DRAFT_624786 [Laccaria amethystina LaAM-08-1]|uniref:Uncharacterized protein n=1 Tax=Laccaria amethystina LaAM-08-1 TaxID=1095629 RepID=A0A0C9WYG1_9AGAR|nr:hypothetical protein K443DRAFT_624786 [Laccaria amethystina LaAM-08-1]
MTNQPAQPVASGSNVRLPYSYWGTDEEMMPTIANDLIVRVGIKVSAPIRTDHEDNNGNFHCRGRDLHDGHQAKADDDRTEEKLRIEVSDLLCKAKAKRQKRRDDLIVSDSDDDGDDKKKGSKGKKQQRLLFEFDVCPEHLASYMALIGGA